MRAAYDRDTLIRNLRDSVVDIHFVDGPQQFRIRGTLWDKYIPNIPENVARINETLNKHPNWIIAWDVLTPGWRTINTGSITYVEENPSY